MSDKKARVPQIRFAGFAGDWDERKLGDVSEKVTEKNKNNIYIETLTNSAEFGIINQRDFFDKDISNEKNLNGYYVVRPDDFVYNPRISNFAPVGPIKRNKLGRTGVMSPLYYVFRTLNVDVTYLEKYFSSDGWQIFMKLNGDSGARADRFAIKDSVFREMPIPIPSIKEQTKIGVFFDNLDNLITLQQRQLVQLDSVKKTMLEKMFPKDGANVPEIRFAGFTGAWEQRKLKDIVEFLDTRRKPLEQGMREKGPYPYYGASGIVDYINDYLFDEELILLSEDGANITDRNYPVCFLATGKYWVNNHAHVLKSKLYHDNNFICNSMERKDFRKYNTGMAMPKLNQEVCRNIPIYCPQYEEQVKIGEHFRNLDTLITLHQRELNALKTLKKSMLQQLFI